MSTTQLTEFDAGHSSSGQGESNGIIVDESLSRQADWSAISAIILSITTFAAAQGLTYPLISLVLEKQGVSETLIGLNAGSYALGLALSTLFIGRLMLLVPGDKLIVLALAGCAICLQIFALSDSFWIWCLARFMLGICASLVFILSEAWLGSACPANLRGRITGIYSAGLCLGFSIGPLAIPLVGIDDGFAFTLNAAYMAMVAVLTLFLVRKAHTRPATSSSGQITLFIQKAPLLIGMVLVFGFVDIAAISTMPVYFVKTGHSESFAALSVTIMALPTAATQPLIGFLLDKLPSYTIVLGTSLVAAIGFMMIPALQSEVLILVVFAVIGATTFALYTCALTILGERFQGGLLVAGCAVFSLANAIGSAGGSTLTGVAMSIFGPVATPVTTGLSLLIFAMIFGCLRR
jgi:predicted MFS family arabinose efflux permease